MSGLVLFGVIVFFLTLAAISGIIMLATRYSKMQPTGRGWAIVGMIVLGGFALCGIAATGCTAFFALHRF